MNKSNHFEELSSTYSEEIDDLVSDSEGKSVLTARLKEKRKELDALLQMIEFAPEMVAPVFFDAFTFTNPALIVSAIACEPDDGDFPTWDSIASSLSLAEWAKPMIQKVLAAAGGDQFMVATAAIEYLRCHSKTAPVAAKERDEFDRQKDEDDEDGFSDLGEAGADWLSQQGFDSHTA
jgi:hypothetical protein